MKKKLFMATLLLGSSSAFAAPSFVCSGVTVQLKDTHSVVLQAEGSKACVMDYDPTYHPKKLVGMVRFKASVENGNGGFCELGGIKSSEILISQDYLTGQSQTPKVLLNHTADGVSKDLPCE